MLTEQLNDLADELASYQLCQFFLVINPRDSRLSDPFKM